MRAILVGLVLLVGCHSNADPYADVKVYTGAYLTAAAVEDDSKTCIQSVDWVGERWREVCWYESFGQICLTLPVSGASLSPCGDWLCLSVETDKAIGIIELKESRLHALIPKE